MVGAIDAIEVYYDTPADYAAKYGYQKAQYRISPINSDGYYSWQFDSETETDKMDMLDALVLRLINSSYVKVLYCLT